MNRSIYTTLFLDIGGVLLTNGWDHHMRENAAKHFNLNYDEMSSRHALTFDTYEIGKISLDEYLNRVVFYKPRQFSMQMFKDFMYQQSQSYPNMIKMIMKVKALYGLRTIAVNNEGKELMQYRVHQFNLKELFDFFVCSSFIGLKKPDEQIYYMALEMAQVSPQEVIYIDDRPMLVEIGKKLGIQSIHHIQFEQTEMELTNLLSDSSLARTR